MNGKTLVSSENGCLAPILGKRVPGFWGMSPCAIPGSYTEFGALPLGTAGYKDQGIVTPHASFLALEFEEEEAFQNILKLKDLNTYGKYGFYDSVNVKTGASVK